MYVVYRYIGTLRINSPLFRLAPVLKFETDYFEWDNFENADIPDSSDSEHGLH